MTRPYGFDPLWDRQLARLERRRFRALSDLKQLSEVERDASDPHLLSVIHNEQRKAVNLLQRVNRRLDELEQRIELAVVFDEQDRPNLESDL